MNARVKKIEMVAFAAAPYPSIMNDDVHHRALAAAVRLSLTCVSLALVPGCDPKPRETTTPVAPEDHAKASPTPAEPDRTGETVTASESYGKPKVDPLPAKMTCEERLDSALPKSGPGSESRIEVARRTKAVIDCCVALVHESSWDNVHFGDCCMVAGEHTDLPQACSPWGPAVPPSIGWAPQRGVA